MSLPVSSDQQGNEVPASPLSDSPVAAPARVAELRFGFATAVLCLAATAWWLFRTHAKLGRDGWYLAPNPVAWSFSAWWLPFGALLIFGGFAAVSAFDAFRRAKTAASKRASIRLSIVALMLLSPVWNWSLMGPGPTPLANGAGNLISVLWSDVATQYFGAAYEISDARAFSREFATRHQKPPSPALAHVATHPPGATLFYYGCRRVLGKVPFLAACFQTLAERVTGESALTLASQANEWRTAGAASAGVHNIQPLPVEAAGAALFVAVVIAAFAAATVPAVYLLAVACNQSTLEADANGLASLRGLAAATLWTLAPMIGLFAYTLDVLVACGAAWTLALAAKYFARPGAAPSHAAWMTAAGALWGLTCWLSFGALAVGAIVMLWAILRRGRQWRLSLRDVVLLSGGFVGVWLLLCVLFPMQPVTLFRQAMAAHHFATLEARRSADWLWLNFFGFWLFSGWPLIALCGARALFSVLRGDGLWRSLKVDSSTTLFLATGVALLTITLSGGVRGETERLWMLFLVPLCVFAASSPVPLAPASQAGMVVKLQARIRGWEPVVLSLALLLLQALQTLMMAAALAPLVRPI